MSDDDMMSRMRERFGDATTDSYVKLTTATRGLLWAWDQFVRAPVGSAEERLLNDAMAHMMQGLRDHPDKATEMIESLLTIIQHLRWGGTVEDWFEGMGVSPTPGEKEK